jgi:tRNA A-37 threonylcarbamoyl transferase component Bud32
MKRINALSVSDQYGENFEDVPSHIITKIRDTIATLYTNGIEYPDITGYNFIYEEDADKLWIIDFEHASYNSCHKGYDPFILDFINGRNDWNPEFK